MSLRGNDRVVIEDGGKGSTTGASKTNTANWKAKSEPKKASKPAAQPAPQASYSPPAPKPIQGKAVFNLTENPETGIRLVTSQDFRNPLALSGPNPSTKAQRLNQTTAALEQAQSDYITAQHHARQTVYRPHRNNDAYREAQRDATAARNRVNALEREAAQLSNNPSFGSRVKNTVLGRVGRSLASDANSAASAYDLTQGARNRMMNEYLADYEQSLSRSKDVLAQLEASGADARDIWSQQNIVDDWQRKYDAMTNAITAQPRATQATYSLADDIKSSADTSIENAKRGLNNFGQLIVDVGAKMTQMGTDAAKSQLLLSQFDLDPKPWLEMGEPEEAAFREKLQGVVKRLPLAGRTYGENTQVARQEGADVKSAAVYGATTAIADAEIEKWFDGLDRFYGKAKTDRIVKKFVEKLGNDKRIQSIIKAGINDLGEGTVESVATDLANQLLKTTYQGRIETEWDRIGRNILINTIIGILLGNSNK